jgi:hypothetical protein
MIIFGTSAHAAFFTGAMTVMTTHRVVRTKLSWLANEDRTASGEPFTSDGYVFVTLQRGPEDSPEYITLSYEFQKDDFDTTANRAHIFRDFSKFNGNQPEITITKAADGHWRGTVDSLVSDLIGDIDFSPAAHTAIDTATALQPLSGYYESYCSPDDQSGLTLTGLELYPTQQTTLPFAADEVLFAIPNYVGALTCREGSSPPADAISCGSLSNGQYDFLNEKVTIRQGTWLWSCDRQNPNQLYCTSPRFPKCLFTKREFVWPKLASVHEKELTDDQILQSIPASLPVPPQSPEERAWDAEAFKADDEGPCQAWTRDDRGIVRHTSVDQFQGIQLKMRGHKTVDPDGGVSCLVTAILKMSFGDAAIDPPVITAYAPVRAKPEGSRILLRPKKDLYDIWVEAWVAPGHPLKADIYSRLFGAVGSFEDEASIHEGDLKGMSLVGPAGIYEMHGTTPQPGGVPTPAVNDSLLTVQVTPGISSSSPNSAFGTEVITGMLEQWIQFGAMNVPARDGITGSSYDYFTNFLMLRFTGFFYFGRLVEGGAVFRKVEEDYLHYANRPLRFTGFKRRTVNS